MGNLYIVRHSVTALNSDPSDKAQKEKIRGWLDVPLSADGWELAEKAALHLKDKKIYKIYSSDLQRARETAEAIAGSHKTPIKLIKALRPWDIGILEGMNFDKGIKIMKYYVEHAPTIPIKDGESYETFYNRWKAFLERLLIATHKIPNDTNLCCVTHSRNIHCLHHILSHGKAPIHFKDVLPPAGILQIDLNTNKITKILS